MKHYDVVIAGGAMVGATLALALDKLGGDDLSVAVIEPYPVEKSHPGFDARAIALSYGSVQILDSFSLWQELQPFVTPIKNIHVSDRGHVGMAEFSAAHQGVDALGYVVELADVGQLYHARLAASGVDFKCPDSVVNIERTQDTNLITLASGEEISCRLFVVADGTQSRCCEKLGLTAREYDFGQVAVIANIVTESGHNNQAYERFTEFGPLALLPMSEQRMSLVWCMSPEQAEELSLLPEEAFLSRLQDGFGWRLGRILQVGERITYPLKLTMRDKIISHRVSVVGNAAQTLHPVAGQGFNLGIRDVAALAELLTEDKQSETGCGVSHAKDVGNYSFLNQYQKSRVHDRSATVDLTYTLVRVFSNNQCPFVVTRNLGLMAVDTSTSLASPFLLRTMGLVERSL
ncbi:2-octaprenyl-6-methoxyphenyl hydroxylase [Vibrio albus]|jgi:2-octaprenyl-6-methoxyphenol hydroxylase|uniref:2-octaprenyl-6-methoxyphenyl hydroxylase n=1 Tax=Vibrio albus TaxID=2200953 RepID=A0A2U3BCZ2_9VIBR|nr:2-octaprenyl-6-methoxyphenyl hydroxylase [Vibrio albus]PWI34633.1 2-octaprenyl-6-methoxyphenyl hydroxylase [Vibrio albus]